MNDPEKTARVNAVLDRGQSIARQMQDREALWDGDGLMCPRCGGVVNIGEGRHPLECTSCKRGLYHPNH